MSLQRNGRCKENTNGNFRTKKDSKEKKLNSRMEGTEQSVNLGEKN